MPLFSKTEVKRLKLETIPADLLKKFCEENSLKIGNVGEMIKSILSHNIPDTKINSFIKKEYENIRKARRKMISDEDLLNELDKVNNFSWGTVQGQLDNKIQVRFVRKYVKFDELIRNVERELYSEVKSYVICTWYNHWTTVLLEDAISQHPKVIPTLKNKKGVDIFFDDQPFDLKITYLPKEYNYKEAIQSPKQLAIWLYENQGAQRFGSDNRLFVILYNSKNPDESWKLKRDMNFIRTEITKFFNSEKVAQSDEIIFTFNNKSYSAVAKILFLIK